MTFLPRRHAVASIGLSTLAMALTQFKLNASEPGIVNGGATVDEWISRLQSNSVDLAAGTITPLQWQEAMDAIYKSTPLPALQQYLSFREVSKKILESLPAERQEFFQRIDVASPGGARLAAGTEPYKEMITKIAYIRKGQSVPPHGHSNMVSAFLCLSGSFDVNLYDRLEEAEETMVVRQTASVKDAGPGTWSSISDYRDNVHWLTAKTDDCYLFTVKMLSLENGRDLKGRIHLDIHSAKKLGRGTVRAQKIPYSRAVEIY